MEYAAWTIRLSNYHPRKMTHTEHVHGYRNFQAALINIATTKNGSLMMLHITALKRVRTVSLMLSPKFSMTMIATMGAMTTMVVMTTMEIIRNQMVVPAWIAQHTLMDQEKDHANISRKLTGEEIIFVTRNFLCL